MKKIDYLKRVVTETKLYQTAQWWFTAFATSRPKDDLEIRERYQLFYRPEGYCFAREEDGKFVLELLEDAEKNKPLFSPQDTLQVDGSWIENCNAPVETNIGSLLSNKLLLTDNFGPKIPYIPYKVNIEDIEAYVIRNRTDADPAKGRDPKKIHLDEYLKMGQGIEFMRTLAPLTVYSLTDKNMVEPDGISELKREVMKKYDNLRDPVQLAAFEKEMMQHASSWLKDDPTMGKLVKGKIWGNAIRKMFISSGAEGGMGKEMVPVLTSLAEGMDFNNPENFQALVNGMRSGSYFRGLDTVKGGVAFKKMVRVLSPFTISEEDCGSRNGVEVIYNEKNISQILGRLPVGAKKRIESKEEAGAYLGKKVLLRSPGYCRTKGANFCKACVGPRLWKFPEGLAIPASDVSSIILAASMAAMHKNTTETTPLILANYLS